jgi:hypothetical protein
VNPRAFLAAVALTVGTLTYIALDAVLIAATHMRDKNRRYTA